MLTCLARPGARPFRRPQPGRASRPATTPPPGEPHTEGGRGVGRPGGVAATRPANNPLRDSDVDAEFVEGFVQLGGVVVDAEGAGVEELVRPVTTAQEPNAEHAGAASRE